MELEAVDPASASDLHTARIDELRWVAGLLEGAKYRVVGLSIAGMEAQVIPASDLVSTEDPIIDASLRPGAALRAFDCGTSSELEEFFVYSHCALLDRGAQVPAAIQGRDPVLVSKEGADALLPSVLEEHWFWVGSPQHAWQRIAIAPGQEEVQCCLSRAASLELVVPRGVEGRPSSLYVLLERRGADNAYETVVQEVLQSRDESVSWRGLESGDYHVMLGRLVGPRRVLGRGSDVPRESVEWMSPVAIELRPGESESIVVPGPLPWTSPGGRLRGIVQVPGYLDDVLAANGSIGVERVSRGADLGGFKLYLPSWELRETHEGLEWSIPWLLPGDYIVTFLPHGVSERVTVREAALTESTLRVEDCEHIEIRVSSGVGAPLDGVSVAWRLSGFEGHGFRGWGSIDRLDESGVGVLLAAHGELELEVSALGHRRARRQVVSGSESAAVEVLLEPATPVRLDVSVATRNGDPVCVPPEFFAEIQARDLRNEEVPTRYSPGPKAIPNEFSACVDAPSGSVEFEMPGTYRLSFPGVDGFASIPDQTLTLSSGSAIELRLQPAWE